MRAGDCQLPLPPLLSDSRPCSGENLELRWAGVGKMMSRLWSAAAHKKTPPNNPKTSRELIVCNETSLLQQRHAGSWGLFSSGCTGGNSLPSLIATSVKDKKGDREGEMDLKRQSGADCPLRLCVCHRFKSSRSYLGSLSSVANHSTPLCQPALVRGD